LVILYATPLALAERKGVPEAITDSENAEDPSAFRSGLVDGEIAVSRLTAKDRGVDTGDTLTLPTVNGPVAFRVATVFDDLAGVDTMYIDRDTFLRHWPDDGAIGFFIAIDEGADPSVVAAALRSTVDDLGLPADVVLRDDHVADIEAGLSGMFSIARSIQLAAVVVAALSLMSTAFTTVLERRWTLGLQRALGMSRAQIARSLALEAAAIAVIGGLGASVIGIAIGVLLAQSFGIVAAVGLPIAIPWPLIAVCTIGALALSLAATAYPRRLATRAQIIDALVTE
jgi:putative ABC transport system permease protein